MGLSRSALCFTASDFFSTDFYLFFCFDFRCHTFLARRLWTRQYFIEPCKDKISKDEARGIGCKTRELFAYR